MAVDDGVALALLSVDAILRCAARGPVALEPCEGGRRTVGGFRVLGVAVLLARVCVGTRLGAAVLAPSEEVGLATPAGRVFVVEGGYRADSFLRGPSVCCCCLDAAPSPVGAALVPFSALAVPFEAAATETLRVWGLLTGRRLGEACRGSASVVLGVEDELVDGPVPADVLGFLRERERAMDVDIAS